MGMDFLTALHVSGTALSAERVRVNLASSNLANAETTRDANGNMYRRLDPVFESMPLGDASEIAPNAAGPMGVRVSHIVADSGPGRKVYSPDTRTPTPTGLSPSLTSTRCTKWSTCSPPRVRTKPTPPRWRP